MENINLVRLEVENEIVNNKIESDLFVIIEETDTYIKFKNGSGFDFIHNKSFELDMKRTGDTNLVKLSNLYIGEHNILVNEQQMIMSLINKYHKELGFSKKDVLNFILTYKEVDLLKEYAIRFNDKLSDCIYFMDFTAFLISKCFALKVGLVELTNLINSFKVNRYTEMVKIDTCSEYIDLFKVATNLEIDRGVYKDIKYSVRIDLIKNVEDLIFLALNNA